jgi:predicted XRE-type DNA-binding protein
MRHIWLPLLAQLRALGLRFEPKAA